MNHTIPTGLSLRVNDPSAVRCDDCERWAYLGQSIRHSSRCDTPDLHAVENVPAVRLTTNRGGRSVVVGSTDVVVPGATFDIDGTVVTVRSVGRSWTSAGTTICYGYLDDTTTTGLSEVEREERALALGQGGGNFDFV